MSLINKKYLNLHDTAVKYFDRYIDGKPFPHIILDNFFNDDFLNKILNEFPKNLEKLGINFDADPQKNKFALNDFSKFSTNTKSLLNYTNSYEFLDFLNKITGIKEKLVPDPYFVGGGLHEIQHKGYLNIHSDFNKHLITNLDRRVNVLIYLNHDWKVEYGGALEFWDKNVKNCIKKINPIFNRMVIFDTNDYSFHGNPDPINHPDNNNSRKSIALYYYSNGRPKNEISGINDKPQFKNRPNTKDISDKITVYKKLFWKIFYKTKIKLK
jgi:Rps23 Pro-64 3,4-dihydroxylase Tpa1-like proline 4-hydroxylase